MSKEKNLFDEFNSVNLTEWTNKIEKDLKGKPLSSLTWNTSEGIDIKPYFNKENSFNYNQTDLLKSGDDNKWLMDHLVYITEEESANKEALRALSGGINSITFKGEFENINVLLKDILINIISINFITQHPTKVIEKLHEFCKEQQINKAEVNITVNYNYILNNNTDKLKNNINKSTEFNSRNIVISNTDTINAGANITQQLAILIAQGNEYLKTGITNPSQFQFNLSLGGNYFFEIAKIRALRILWKNVLDAYNIESKPTSVHCETSTLFWNKTDNENNILRASSTAMSAIVGGCDSLTVTPHNLKTEALSNRIAKNIQLLLKEESYLDKVKDPSAGSYYIEHLTNTLAQNSWNLFQEIEANGGYLNAIENNFIPGLISKTADELIERFNNGEITIIGVTKYNNKNINPSLIKEKQPNSPLNKLVLKEN